MPRTLYEDWIKGPHDPKDRSLVGAFFSRLIESRAWEYLFLAFITFNAVIKFTSLRSTSEEWQSVLLGESQACVPEITRPVHALTLALRPDISFYALVVYTAEWLIELFTLGTKDFFDSTWYVCDTIVNFFNYGSYFKAAGYLPHEAGLFLPNIAFLRLLRFLKPLGRVRALFASKIVVKTVAGALAGVCVFIHTQHTHAHMRTHAHTRKHAYLHTHLDTCTRTHMHAYRHGARAVTGGVCYPFFRRWRNLSIWPVFLCACVSACALVCMVACVGACERVCCACQTHHTTQTQPRTQTPTLMTKVWHAFLPVWTCLDPRRSGLFLQRVGNTHTHRSSLFPQGVCVSLSLCVCFSLSLSLSLYLSASHDALTLPPRQTRRPTGRTQRCS